MTDGYRRHHWRQTDKGAAGKPMAVSCRAERVVRLTRVALRLLPDTCHALLAAVLRCADYQVPVHQRPLPLSPLQMGLKHTAPHTPLTDP